ncbi:zinc finger CCCH domain-containing protein 8 isoform X3 [Tachyglossus aculeatus]|uniref:zinc finger CCCH domain-containing protein 8 isoform X3 n=1 Tax=Tachyglossus aculeatus TaxID=9261 RepID=UPI0018F33380|nr:zinc finger CCCH domain-containing protein 8 isoform X3 [Tachyglossus aculeatus]
MADGPRSPGPRSPGSPTLSPFYSLFSKPPNPPLGPAAARPGCPGEQRKGGEIKTAGFEDPQKQEAKGSRQEKREETHRKSREKSTKAKEQTQRRWEKPKHNSPGDDNSSNCNLDLDTENSSGEPPKKRPVTHYRDYDKLFLQECQESKNWKYDECSSPLGKFSHSEEEDFADQLKQYIQAKETSSTALRTPVPDEALKTQEMKGIQQSVEQKGKDLSVGRGRGLQKKTKRKDRGRGRGGNKGPNAFSGTDGFQEPSQPVKKCVKLSQEFINQHTVERKGKQICKYFLDGRCIKGEQCRFEHEGELEKRKEICKFYIQGYCNRGENCRYMHNEYPCKFYHTRTKCYQGDKCKFSHAPLTEETKELLDKVLNHGEKPVNEVESSSEHPGIEDPVPPPPPVPPAMIPLQASCLPAPPRLFSVPESKETN